MADISTELAAIMSAIYGRDVRQSIYDAIDKINKVTEVQVTAGTAVTSTDSSSEGFYDGSLYINTNTWILWKCTGVNTWTSMGSFIGNGIARIDGPVSSGLIDTYTIVYDNGDTRTFTITNGENGNRWFRGTAVSGKSVNPTVFSNSGIPNARQNDLYLNPNDDGDATVYYCVTGGAPEVATWSFYFAIAGGGGSGVQYLTDLSDVNIVQGTAAANQVLKIVNNVWTNVLLALNDLSDIAILTPGDRQALMYDVDSGKFINSTIDYDDVDNTPDVDQTYDGTSPNAQSGVAIQSQLTGKANTTQLDEWHKVNDVIQTITVTSVDTDETITFTDLDTTKSYELWFDTDNPVDPIDTKKGAQITVKSSSTSGTSKSYVVSTPVNPTTFRLVKKGNL